MHDLDEDAAALVMHGGRHILPTGDIGRRVDAGRREIALSIVRGLSAFGHNQADAGALRIVYHRKIAGRPVGLGAAARHRRHDETVWQRVASDANGRKCLLHSCPQRVRPNRRCTRRGKHRRRVSVFTRVAVALTPLAGKRHRPKA